MGSPETDRLLRPFQTSVDIRDALLPDGNDGNTIAEYGYREPWCNPQNVSKSELSEEAVSRRLDLSSDEVLFSGQNLRWLLEHGEPDSESD